MRACANCGKAVDESEKFCGSCGAAQAQQPEPTRSEGLSRRGQASVVMLSLSALLILAAGILMVLTLLDTSEVSPSAPGSDNEVGWLHTSDGVRC